MWRVILITASLILLSACQTPANMQQLQNRNQTLQNKLSSAENRLKILESERSKLSLELKDARRVIKLQDGEKTERVKESTRLRGQVRTFAQNQIDSLKTFMVNSSLLDYIGGELIRRKKYDQRPLMLVDLKNKIPQNGVLNGVAGNFVKPTKLIVKVLRPIKDQLVVIWESRPILINNTGLVKKNFSVTVGVEKGDIVAYYFPKSATVSFDEGTADTRYTDKKHRLGQAIELSSLSGQSKGRAYSIGVYALLK